MKFVVIVLVLVLAMTQVTLGKEMNDNAKSFQLRNGGDILSTILNLVVSLLTSILGGIGG
ncbi:hypothetical protein CHUAL_008260 [Chamberlinius hualienensis]